MRRWRSFPVQLFVLIVFPLVALLLIITLGSLTLHQQAMRNMVGERDERAIRAAAAAISEQLNHRHSAIRSLALQVAVTHDPEHALADATFLLPDFEGGVALYTTQGTLLATSTTRETWQTWSIPGALLARGNFPIGEASFLPPVTDPQSGESRLLVVAQEETFIAVGAFSPANLARQALTDLFGVHDWAAAFIISSEGTVLYQTGIAPLSVAEIQTHPGVAEALGGESGTTYRSVGGEEHVIAFSPIEPVVGVGCGRTVAYCGGSHVAGYRTSPVTGCASASPDRPGVVVGYTPDCATVADARKAGDAIRARGFCGH